jgi:short-subunit dehydrogenase
MVIGASSALGAAVAERLHRDGLCVSGTSRREGAPGRAVDAWYRCDAGIAAEVEHAVARAVADHGAPELVVYAVGHAAMGRTLEIAATDARRCFDVNLWGFDAACRAVLPSMAERRCGTIVALSTVAALRSLRYQAFYGSSKAALDSYVGSLDEEAQLVGVRVKSLRVGYVDTGFFERAEWYGTKPPRVAGSGVTPDDVTDALMRLVESGHRHAVVGWREKLIALGDRVSPALYDWWLRGQARR